MRNYNHKSAPSFQHLPQGCGKCVSSIIKNIFQQLNNNKIKPIDESHYHTKPDYKQDTVEMVLLLGDLGIIKVFSHPFDFCPFPRLGTESLLCVCDVPFF